MRGTTLPQKTIARRVVSRVVARDFSLRTAKIRYEECTDSRQSGNVYLRVAGDFEQIYDNGMHLGQPISLPSGRNPGLSFAPALSFESQIEFKSGQPNCLRSLETRNRLATITSPAIRGHTNEIRSLNRAGGDKNCARLRCELVPVAFAGITFRYHGPGSSYIYQWSFCFYAIITGCIWQVRWSNCAVLYVRCIVTARVHSLSHIMYSRMIRNRIIRGV